MEVRTNHTDELRCCCAAELKCLLWTTICEEDQKFVRVCDVHEKKETDGRGKDVNGERETEGGRV